MLDRELYIKIRRARSATLAKWWTAVNRRKWPRELRQWETDDTNGALAVMNEMASELGTRWIMGRLTTPPPPRN